MENQNELEIDVRELGYLLKKKLWLVSLITVVCGILGMVLSVFVMEPQYTASSRVYILNQANETALMYSDFQASTFLMRDYEVLITGRNVTKAVIEDLELDLSVKELTNIIEVTSRENTRVIQINVTHGDPQMAADIANHVREVAAEQIAKIMDVDAVKTVYAADVPENPSGPNVVMNTILAAALGFLAMMGLLVIQCMLDDAITSEEDVERYLGLSTLGIVPATKELGHGGSRGTGKTKK